ncbi:MAG TPA: hypothetical protein VIY08_15345 [Candidatus Nitrosocosmicus sp.]
MTCSLNSALIYAVDYLDDIRNNRLPHIRIDIPIPIIIEPLTVQPGLLYMNEEDGPTMDLLCSVNTIPKIVNIMPTVINGRLARLFRFINYKSVVYNNHFNYLGYKTWIVSDRVIILRYRKKSEYKDGKVL